MSRKSSRKHARRRARESAISLLYSGDIIEVDAADIVERGAYPAGDINVSEYAESLVAGVSAHRGEIDEYIRATSENWALDRMPVVDRAILRLAVYEMLFVDDVPVSVAINEAVELAKAYGGEDESSRFVNGVLGRISRMTQDDEAGSAEAPPEVAVLREEPQEGPQEEPQEVSPDDSETEEEPWIARRR